MQQLDVNDIFEEVSKEFDATPQEIEFAYDACMRAFRVFIQGRQSVVIHNLGKFYIVRQRTMRRIITVFRKYKFGDITRNALKDKIRYFWPYHEAARHHKIANGLRYKRKMRDARTDEERKRVSAH